MSERAKATTRFLRRLLLPLTGLMLLLVCGSAGAATITVNTESDTTADDGACTLREAITSANTDTTSGPTPGECAAGSGADIVAFTNHGPRPQVIAPDPDLPDLTTPIAINGSSDPGQIVIDGNSTTDPYGFYITGSNVIINDLTIVRWSYGVWITDNADSVQVNGSRVGTNTGGAGSP